MYLSPQRTDLCEHLHFLYTHLQK